MTKLDLKDCPFCGARPETDLRRPYRQLSSGEIGSGVAIYCTGCDAEMMLCFEDFPECDTDELFEEIAANWNKRTSP